MAADARASCRNVSEPRLELVPVGVGSAIAAPGEAQSSYLVRAGAHAVVMDLGSGTFSRLQTHIAPEDVETLLITHLHPDHCVDLMALRVYMVWGPGAGGRIRVVGPPGLRERLSAFSGSDAWDTAFSFEEFAPVEGSIDLGDGLAAAPSRGDPPSADQRPAPRPRGRVDLLRRRLRARPRAGRRWRPAATC